MTTKSIDKVKDVFKNCEGDLNYKMWECLEEVRRLQIYPFTDILYSIEYCERTNNGKRADELKRLLQDYRESDFFDTKKMKPITTEEEVLERLQMA